MKKYFRIMALLACTAALCVSALAAGTEAPGRSRLRAGPAV